MACNSASALAFLLISSCLLGMAWQAFGGRDIPMQPEFFFGHHEGTVLIPGVGRVMIPPKHHGKINPFTYDPITGTNRGGVGLGSLGGFGGGTGRSYIPGGDDTFVPNPGVEVPIPGGTGGNVPTASSRP